MVKPLLAALWLLIPLPAQAHGLRLHPLPPLETPHRDYRFSLEIEDESLELEYTATPHLAVSLKAWPTEDRAIALRVVFSLGGPQD